MADKYPVRKKQTAAAPKDSGPWHALDEEQLIHRVSSGETGLESSEVPHRIEQFGRNTLEAEGESTAIKIILHQLHNPLIYLLIGAAAVSMVTGHMIDAAVIAGVVVLNTMLGAIQEWKADRALDALKKMGAPHARVIRDGRELDVAADEIVPGDVLVLETGDRVAADARVLESAELQVDESALTGESEPVYKRPGVLPEEQQLAERSNMLWMSTAVTSGRGRAVVVGTGMNTVLGRIAGEVREAGREETPLQKRMGRLGTALGVVGISLAFVIFILGMLRGVYETMEMVLYAIAVAVSAIPEGLPAVISITLALGVQRMVKRNAVIRRLPAVETLGSTTVICSDKTGTITRNEMTVTSLWTLSDGYAVAGSGFEPKGEIHPKDSPEKAGELGEDVRMLLWIGALANNARIVEENGAWRVRGTPTEGAIIIASHKAGVKPEKDPADGKRLAEIPFASEFKYMATLNQTTGGASVQALVKGAPDRVLGFCSHILENGQRVELTEERRRAIEEANIDFGGQALRVVAAAYKDMPGDAASFEREDVENGLTFVGLWGMVDPPRPEAVTAIADAQGAGIRIVMITGDHAVTAAAIARQVGIATHGEEVITGAELDKMSDSELSERVERVGVFARVSPSHKLRILRALKDHGEIVAMTGDGVNDAPALKGADIGVAMGIAGTEVAKEAADIVLSDDDFATIVHAVEEGRVIFSNLRRVVFFLITTNLGEILTLAVALMIGMPLPLTAIMILWINLVTDGVATIPLGIEPRHWDVLKQPPRHPDEGLLNKKLLRRMFILAPLMAAGVLLLYWYELHIGSEKHAQTVAFTTLAAFQWFNALNARSSYVSVFSIGFFHNLWLWAGILTAIALQVLVVHTPAGQLLFGTEHLTFVDWLLVTGVASSILIVDEILKLFGVHGRLPGSEQAEV